MPHESISVFDMLKIGVGPSSSHTLGPWRAAQRFTDSIREKGGLEGLTSLRVLLYGSLAKTGKGHGTDIAIQLGLAGEDPVTFDVGLIDRTIQTIATEKRIAIRGSQVIVFDPAVDIEFLFSET
ncbi:MAG TPA: serine dehydratase beta chain, partial [Puia sp.]